MDPSSFHIILCFLTNVSPVGVGGQALAGFFPGTWGKGQEAGAEPEKLQGQWDDAEGVMQKQGGRAVLGERTELLVQSRQSTQQSTGQGIICVCGNWPVKEEEIL